MQLVKEEEKHHLDTTATVYMNLFLEFWRFRLVLRHYMDAISTNKSMASIANPPLGKRPSTSLISKWFLYPCLVVFFSICTFYNLGQLSPYDFLQPGNLVVAPSCFPTMLGDCRELMDASLPWQPVPGDPSQSGLPGPWLDYPNEPTCHRSTGAPGVCIKKPQNFDVLGGAK